MGARLRLSYLKLEISFEQSGWVIRNIRKAAYSTHKVLFDTMAEALPSNVRVSSNFDALVNDLASFVVQAADRAVRARDRFLIGLSGGSLPTTLAEAMRTAVESGSELHMDKWHVFYVDERVVPLD